MAASISASVGSYESGAKNNFADVRTVQALLTAVAKKLNSALYDPQGVDGLIARPGSRSATVLAITNFQKLEVGMMRPDQRIDVNGGTWHKLVKIAGPATPTNPATPAKPINLITLTVTHGGKIPSKTKLKTDTATTTDMYESTFTLSGGLTGTFRGSIWPDDMTVKGHLVDGTYPLHIGFHKGGGAAKEPASSLVVKTQGIRAGLLVNARSGVTVKSDDPGKTTSYGINVHNGFSTSRGSDGCLTLHPDDWSKFIKLFLDAFPNIDDWHTLGNNTGKKVGSLVIKKS